MRFTSIFAVAVAGLSALASAVAMPDSGSANQNTVFAPVASSVVKAGVKFNIQWAPNAGKYVDLVLRKGTDETQLQEVQVICTRLPNVGLFIWEPSTELAGGSDYSIEVTSHDRPSTTTRPNSRSTPTAPASSRRPPSSPPPPTPSPPPRLAAALLPTLPLLMTRPLPLVPLPPRSRPSRAPRGRRSSRAGL
ncbi:hypothetical protein FN846DRAFT_123452 [Sphaerosporella brunnea]|uniref:Yeast cell wall synthesis Kre9/Knh1-like N-terminal domain-containing protein n=1 Tax=Sphaerosporella brunnea TaxID=1250544 RepID=A0A5J5ET04_9PEZI|nr:hypothetical protein FN846DRAFT_123452 [Sphaerosporella brunnea]